MYKVLIVDDEQLERVALRYTLNKSLPELNVIGEARNGNEAVEMAKEYEPHIILMDIKMPGKSGLEAAREINMLQPETKIIMLTAFDSFEYAKSALQIGVVEYLLKPVRPQELIKVLEKCVNDLNTEKKLAVENKQIKKTLAKLLPYYENSYVYDLINGNINNEKEIEERASILQINQLPAIVMIIGIEKVASQSNKKFDCQLTRQKVFEIVQEIFSDNNVLITSIIANKVVVLIPCSSNSLATETHEYCYKKGQNIIRKLTKEDIIVSIGIGNYYTNTSMIQQSYLEALMAQRNSAFAEGNEINSWFSFNQSESNKIIEFKDQQEADLSKFMYMENIEQIPIYIDLWWKKIRSSNLGENLQKACALELIINLYRGMVITELDRQSLAVLNLSIINKLLDSNNLDELGNCINQAVNEIIEIVKISQVDTIASTVKMAQSFINANFSKDIMLEDVAKHVHVSSCYLSRIFSKEVGMPFKKYLVKVRLNHAKKLLLTTITAVSEIASEIGYQDTSYFCRIFKQEENLSPNEYRTKYKQERQIVPVQHDVDI